MKNGLVSMGSEVPTLLELETRLIEVELEKALIMVEYLQSKLAIMRVQVRAERNNELV